MSSDTGPSRDHRRYDRAWWAVFAVAVVVNTLLSGGHSRIRLPVGIAFLVVLIWLFRLSLRERARARKAAAPDATAPE